MSKTFSPAPIEPSIRPARPYFSSGPTAKWPGFSADSLNQAPLGRSNRSNLTVDLINKTLGLTREILAIPAGYKVFFWPGSDTGAFEAALWNLLGARGIQVLSFESFSQLWADDVSEHLGLEAEILTAPYGHLPDLSAIKDDHDLVFPWNGTTSGVCMPHADFLRNHREGLVFCDATSAAFCMELPWESIDVGSFSFQKALGGEAGIGVLILSPRAVLRLNQFHPQRPLPKILRLRKGAKADEALLNGEAVNTFSFMVIEDYYQSLLWAQSCGGLMGLINRTQANFQTVARHLDTSKRFAFCALDPNTRSSTSVCLTFQDEHIKNSATESQRALSKAIALLLYQKGVGYDLESYRQAPPGLRIWCGPTVDQADVSALMPWLDWAYDAAMSKLMGS